MFRSGYSRGGWNRTKASEEISFRLDTIHAYPYLLELHGPGAGQFYTLESKFRQLICRLTYRQSTLVTNNCQALLRCRAVVVNDLPTLRELTKNKCEETMRSLPHLTT
jgi:hypothetical protein